MRTTSLTSELTLEHGDVLPPELIASTVRAAAGGPDAARDEGVLEQTARADVAALAEAVRRRAPDR